MKESAIDMDRLMAHARSARSKAYAPYSGFKVGSAVITKTGRIYEGCNVENAAYGLSNCAERTALFRAIADGCRPGDFLALAVVADSPQPVAPCGACRQVIVELCAPDMPVIMGNVNGDHRVFNVEQLLPGAFSRVDLEK